MINHKNYLTNLDTITAAPVAHWGDRILILWRIRRAMTLRQYIAYCKAHEPLPR